MQHTKRRALGALLGAALIGAITPGAMVASAAEDGADWYAKHTTIRLSVSSSGEQANGPSERPTISADGSKAAFISHATNLVPGDTNKAPDVFVRDLLRGTTTRVNVSNSGEQANGGTAIDVRIDASGRYVAYASDASNLVPGDTNGKVDVFIRDLWRGTTKRISVASDGTQANGNSLRPSMSALGRYVAYTSMASNLVPGDSNGTNDIYRYDQETGATTRISVLPDGTQPNGACDAPQVSADGQYIQFFSLANNLVPGDVNDFLDVFRKKLSTGEVSLMSTNQTGGANDDLSVGGISSADNRYVSFASHATNLTPQSPPGHDSHPYILDTRTNVIHILDVNASGQVGDSGGFWSGVTLDSSRAVFTSASTNVVPGDTNAGRDVFSHDLATHQVRRVSIGRDGAQGNDASYFGFPNVNGSVVAFMSFASNLVPGDTNGAVDVFVRIDR